MTDQALTVNPTEGMAFDERMAFELALRFEAPEVILERYGVDEEKWLRLSSYGPFKAALKRYKGEVDAKGITFKTKAKLLAEDFLDKIYLLVHDPDCPYTVKLKAIENAVRWAELEPAKGADGGSGQTFNLRSIYEPRCTHQDVQCRPSLQM